MRTGDMEYAEELGESRTREVLGVVGRDDGEEYAKRRFLVGVVGGTMDGARAGEDGLCGDGGVTSVCSILLKMELACSFKASDSDGMIRDLDGVEGPASPIKW